MKQREGPLSLPLVNYSKRDGEMRREEGRGKREQGTETVRDPPKRRGAL
jgi:hypothetical protein